MKNTVKVLAIIALAAVIGFSMAACKLDSDGVLSGTITANEHGHISFNFVSFDVGGPNSVTVTTDLPAPDNSFTMTHNVHKEIVITPGQEVKWTAKTDKGILTYDDGINFVHFRGHRE